MLPELNKFYVKTNLSVFKCTFIPKNGSLKDSHYIFSNPSEISNYAFNTEYFENNFHELVFQCDIDTLGYKNYKNHQFITELFELIIDKNSDYNMNSNNIKLNPSKEFEHVDLSYDDHKYIAKGSKDIAIIENIRQNKTKTLYDKIMALQNSGLSK